jgi:hypothetical protein
MESTVRRLQYRTSRSASHVYLQAVSAANGMIDWREVQPRIPGISVRKRGAQQVPDDLIWFRRLEPSRVTAFLERQDARFTPQRGLQRWSRSKGLSHYSLPDSGRVLLFLHGTFSNGENLLNSMLATAWGRDFLEDAERRYQGGIFVFDHPTISVGPWLNAWSLQQFLSVSSCKLDIISYSRGGLVARWWCESFDSQLERCENAILVGSPLIGTGLASPPNLRAALNLLTSYANALTFLAGVTSGTAPILGLVNTLLHVVTSVTTIAAIPMFTDAILAMVPGMCAQSRISNNIELRSLHQANTTATRYAAVLSDFMSESPGWEFWKYFRPGYLSDKVMDILFDGANDLIVDTDSMIVLGPNENVPVSRRLDFGTNDHVHHINYLDHPRTIEFLRDMLSISKR